MSAKSGIKRIAIMAGLVTLSFLSGCGKEEQRELVPPADMTYNSTQRTTAVVEKGDFTYSFEYEIVLAGFQEFSYRISPEKLAEMETVYDMKLDSVNITVGDYVKEGQTLVSFHSKELDDQLESSRQNRELARIKLDHLARISALEPEKDHTEQMKVLENEVRVADLYVSDIQSVYSSFNIISESDGIVSEVDPALNEGQIAPGKILIRIAKNDGYYEMDMASKAAPAGYSAKDFQPGDRLMAKNASTEYEVEVIEPPAGREDEENKVFLRPVTDADKYLGDTLKVSGKPTTKQNTCHVDKKAVIKTEDGTYVWVRNEAGEFQAVKVTVGDTIGSEVVILEGLEGGENVALQQ